MGGALSLHAAYRWDRTVAGAFVISSFLNNESAVYRDLKANPGPECKLSDVKVNICYFS